MKSDIDDPNNHVPEVSPDDGWDDVDTASEKPKLGLPPRRNERSLPPKKETRRPIVKRHEPKPVSPRTLGEAEDSEPDDQPELRLDAPAKKAAKKAAKKPASKSAKKAPREAVKITADKIAAKPPAPALSEIEEETSKPEDEEDGVRLPPAPNKPNRLSHRIGTGDIAESDPRPATRPIQKIAAPPEDISTAASDEDVARMRRRFVRGERQDWGEEKGRDSTNWMIFTGVGVVLLVILTVALSQMGGKKKSRESDKSRYSQLAPEEEKEAGDLAILEMLTNSQEAAKDIYGKFATAVSPAALKDSLINGKKILPLVQEDWKQLVSEGEWVPGDQAVWTVLDRNGQRYGVLAGSHPDFSNFKAFFRKDGEALKLDWKATTGYGTATFEEMKTGAGDASEIRAQISLSDFYTFALPEGEYRSFRLMSPDGNSNLWAYTERDGDLDRELMELFIPSQITGESQFEVQVTLVMEPGPENGLKNQWLIRKLTSLSWLDEIQK